MHRWDDRINRDLTEINEDVGWIWGSVSGLVAGFCEYGTPPVGSITCWRFYC
jgi:hypothetical protein